MYKEINESRINHRKKPTGTLSKKEIMFDEETGEKFENNKREKEKGYLLYTCLNFYFLDMILNKLDILILEIS